MSTRTGHGEGCSEGQVRRILAADTGQAIDFVLNRTAGVRREAVKQIALISLHGDAATTAALVALIKDRDPHVRLHAIRAIRRVGARGHPAVIDAVLMGLSDSDVQVRPVSRAVCVMKDTALEKLSASHVQVRPVSRAVCVMKDTQLEKLSVSHVQVRPVSHAVRPVSHAVKVAGRRDSREPHSRPRRRRRRRLRLVAGAGWAALQIRGVRHARMRLHGGCEAGGRAAATRETGWQTAARHRRGRTRDAHYHYDLARPPQRWPDVARSRGREDATRMHVQKRLGCAWRRRFISGARIWSAARSGCGGCGLRRRGHDWSRRQACRSVSTATFGRCGLQRRRRCAASAAPTPSRRCAARAASYTPFTAR